MAIVLAAGAIIWQNRQFLSTYTGFALHSPAADTWQCDVAVLLDCQQSFLSSCHI